MAFTSARKQTAPEIVPDDLLAEMIKVTPPITLAETSFHQKMYTCVVSYFDLLEKKPAPKNPDEPSEEAKRAHKIATEGLSKT
jgi:hypothetical protein